VAEEEPALQSLRDAIDQFGKEQAPKVVETARTEAVARAASVLAEAMADSLLRHARRQLAAEAPKSAPARRAPARRTGPAPAPEPEAAAGTPDPDRDDELAYYVYGVASAGERVLPDDLEGVAAEHRPFTIEHAGLSAIASLVPLSDFDEEQLHENLNDVDWLERTARAHESVLDAALASTTVVPLRLCTIYRNEDQVREMIDRERAVFQDALRRLEGKTEWGVKLIAERGALERAASPGDSPEAKADVSPGMQYMRERGRAAQARENADRIAEEWADRVHRRVASRAAEALLNPLQNPEVSGHTGEMLLNGVYLVDEEVDEAFRAEVAALADEFRELGASVELTGPWPPYNFVKGSIEAAR
jgi:hypothetical protein